MTPRARAHRPRIAAGLAVVLTTLSVAVPLLDRGRDPGALAISEPGTTTGYVDHHHGVCVQHSAAAWSPAPATASPSAALVHDEDAIRDAVRPSDRSLRFLHHSRAPPQA